MGLFFPTAAAILQSGSVLTDKLVLKIKGITHKSYIGISFPLIFLFTLIIYLIIRPEFSKEMFQTKYLLLIVLSVIIGAITNILFYRALKSDLLSEMETISLLSNVPLIVFTGIFLVEERNYFVMSLAFISALAIVWSHWERHHFHIAKKTWPFLVWILAIAPFGGIISKIILQTWNPILLQLFRDGLLVVVFVPLFFHNVKHAPKSAYPLLILTNLLTSIAWILYFFSYKTSGVIYTVLIFSLQPMLVYFASLIFLKEKLHWRKLVAFLVILTAIVLAQILK